MGTNNSSAMMTFKWIARALSIASVFVLSLFVFGGQERMAIPNLNQMIGFALFPIGIVIGMLLGWKSALLGGGITTVCLVGFYAWHFMQTGNLPTGPWFLIFALPGILFFVIGLMSIEKAPASEEP